jgi:hypothetical protein
MVEHRIAEMNGNTDISIARAPRPAAAARRLAAVDDGEAHTARPASPPRVVGAGEAAAASVMPDTLARNHRN